MSDLQVAIEQADARIELGELPVIEADADPDAPAAAEPAQQRAEVPLRGACAPVVRISRAPATRPSARSTAPRRRALCEITVADNGIGFEQDYAERIFGIFQRLHGRSEYPGTGIGLATCRKILERHGGAIAASGRPGEGATFVFTLPARQSGDLPT